MLKFQILSTKGEITFNSNYLQLVITVEVPFKEKSQSTRFEERQKVFLAIGMYARRKKLCALFTPACIVSTESLLVYIL